MISKKATLFYRRIFDEGWLFLKVDKAALVLEIYSTIEELVIFMKGYLRTFGILRGIHGINLHFDLVLFKIDLSI